MNGRVSKIIKRAARVTALKTTEKALKRTYIRTPAPEKHMRLNQLRAATELFYSPPRSVKGGVKIG